MRTTHLQIHGDVMVPRATVARAFEGERAVRGVVDLDLLGVRVHNARFILDVGARVLEPLREKR